MVLDTSSDVVSEINRLRIGLGTPDKDIKLKPVGGDPADHGEAPVKTVKVSVTALPTPPFSPALTQDTLPMGLPELAQPELSTPPEEKKFGAFYFFPLLPPELRLKIWYLSFLPRTIELHTRRMHYADSYDLDDGGNPKWRSSSTNPAALSVNTEARYAALEHYTVPLRLASPIIPNQPYELPSALYTLSDRVLHISPEHDTVVLLGDLHYTRLKRLLDWFRLTDPARYKKNGSRMGLRKIAMSMAPWAHAVGAATLRAFARTLFADIDEFALFMYADRVPPAEWEGGRCVLREASGDEDFFMGFGKQFMDSGSGGRGWMRVGRGEMKVADISFEEGWQ